MSIRAVASHSWINMLSLFAEQVFRVDSVLNQPMVGLTNVDSLVHGLLLAADHPYRSVETGEAQPINPRAIRTAAEIIEDEASSPLTVSSIAARCHVSVRSLQQDFRRYMGTSPMAYLREVRLRRAHQSLLESDPSVTSVATVAYHWGFTNLGRFAAAHTARYDEPPAATLRRRVLAEVIRKSDGRSPKPRQETLAAGSARVRVVVRRSSVQRRQLSRSRSRARDLNSRAAASR
jgi:AraC-like DNA-binding protein